MLTSPSDADLEASLQLLEFMWLGAGNDPSAITPEVAQMLRLRLAQNFLQLPVMLQVLFANAGANFATLQRQWHAATPDRRLAMAVEFQQFLALLGLVANPAAPDYAPSGGNSYNADIASNIAWHASQAGDWSAR